MSNALRFVGDRLLGAIVPSAKAEASVCYNETYYNGCYHSQWCDAGHGCETHWVKASKCSDPWYYDGTYC